MMKNLHNAYNEWLREYGLSEIPESSFFYTSPYLTIYDYPKEIDYSNEVSVPSNIYGFDNFMRSEKSEEFELPEELRNKSGKLVYLSLGSMASGNVKLMKRLISILSKSQHKFIVSKGQLHDQYELADNMWGQKFLPQTKILPLVDLVISHGGNNTLTEAFYFGKPLIVLPLFGDQFDNAQRVQDTGYGIRLDALNCSETELLEAIEKLVNDSDLKLKLEKISERIQTSKSLNKVVDLIEGLVN
jgi:UDP:flavonoid glycosyltransferase YjiC (YdhE family)